MQKIILRKTNTERRKVRNRSKILGTSERPRLSVFKSNKYTYAQVIDDIAGKTLIDVSSKVKEMHKGKTKIDAASAVGEAIAKEAKDKKITKVVFDRGPYRYHGRVKSLADGARKGGLDF